MAAIERLASGRNALRVALTVAAIASPSLLLICVCANAGGAEERKVSKGTVPELSVTLLGAPGDARVDGLRLQAADLHRRHVLALRMPNGQTISLEAISTSWASDSGVVQDVYVRRPMKPVRFKEAVADLRRVMKEMGVEPSQQMKEQMSLWPEDVPGVGEGGEPYPFKTGVRSAFEKVDIDIRVCPAPQGGWYYLLIFGVEVEERPSIKAIRQAQRKRDNGSEQRMAKPGRN